MQAERNLLAASIRAFEGKAARFLNLPGARPSRGYSAEPADFEDTTSGRDRSSQRYSDSLPIEQCILSLPSSFEPEAANNEATAIELDLRKQRATRCIYRIRDIIADKSFNYLHILRQASTTAMTLRSRKRLKTLNQQLSQNWKAYNLCRSAFLAMKAPQLVLEKFKDMSRSDLSTSTAVEMPNLLGETSSRLSWIWQFRGADGPTTRGVNECEWSAGHWYDMH